jgi:hypothetical protein
MSFAPAATETQGTNQAITISDTVAYTGPAAPTGAVTYTLNGVGYTATCTGSSSPLTCSATVPGATIAALAVNSYTVTAAIAAAGNYGAATGASGTFTITAPTTGTIKFSSVTHNMGSVTVGDSTTYGVQMTNTSSLAVTYTGITLNTTASPNPFTQANNCGTSLAAGASCEIVFTFAPAAGDTGTLTATWSLAGTPGGTTFTPSNGGTLTGTVAASGNVTISTAGHNFGDVTVGTTSAVYGTVITNSTNASVTLTLGSVTSPFALVTNCPTTLAAGGSCNLNFTFSPTTTGLVQQMYSIAVNGGAIPLLVNGSPTTGVTLTGTGD